MIFAVFDMSVSSRRRQRVSFVYTAVAVCE